jgi:hypothetical protein
MASAANMGYVTKFSTGVGSMRPCQSRVIDPLEFPVETITGDQCRKALTGEVQPIRLSSLDVTDEHHFETYGDKPLDTNLASRRLPTHAEEEQIHGLCRRIGRAELTLRFWLRRLS